MRLVKEHGHSSICRRSVIQSEEYRKRNTVNGQDLGALYLEVLELPAKGENYMAYRTVKEFPIVGDVVNKAVEQPVTGQLSPRDAMNAAQEQAVANLRRAGTCASKEAGLLDAERRSFNRWALAPSLIVLFLIAVVPAIYLLAVSLTPFQLVNPGSATDFSAPLRIYLFASGRSAFRYSCRQSCRSGRPLYYAAGLLHLAMPSLTSSVDFALIAIIIADTWEWLPYTFLMVLAALRTIS